MYKSPVLITCNPPNFLWTFQVTASKARDVCPKAVADQVDFFKRVLIVHLLQLHVVFMYDDAQVHESLVCCLTRSACRRCAMSFPTERVLFTAVG